MPEKPPAPQPTADTPAWHDVPISGCEFQSPGFIEKVQAAGITTFADVASLTNDLEDWQALIDHPKLDGLNGDDKTELLKLATWYKNENPDLSKQLRDYTQAKMAEASLQPSAGACGYDIKTLVKFGKPSPGKESWSIGLSIPLKGVDREVGLSEAKAIETFRGRTLDCRFGLSDQIDFDPEKNKKLDLVGKTTDVKFNASGKSASVTLNISGMKVDDDRLLGFGFKDGVLQVNVKNEEVSPDDDGDGSQMSLNDAA